MKNSIVIVSLSISLFLLSFAPPSKMKYTSKEGKLMVTFPNEYKTEDKNTEAYSSKETKATLDGQLFFVTYNIHNVKLTNHESLAKTSLESFVEAIGGTITSQNVWIINNNNGLKARLKIEKNDLIAEYGVVLVGDIQYQVAVVSETAKWNQARSDAFFKSFKLKK